MQLQLGKSLATNLDTAPKIENGSGLMHSNSVDTDSKDGKDKEDMEMDEGNEEEEEEDEMDSAPLDFTKPGRVHN